MTDDLTTKLTELTELRPEPADPAATVRIGIRRRQRRRRGTGVVLVTAAATTLALAAGPALGALRSGGAEPEVAGPGGGPAVSSTTVTSATVLPPPWSDEVFTKLPEANAYLPKAYYVARGKVTTESWAVLAFSDKGRSAGCLVGHEGSATSFGRPYYCFDNWPNGRRVDYKVVQSHVKEKASRKLNATLVTGAVSIKARKVQIRTSTGATYVTDAVGTPASSTLRFFAMVIPEKDLKVTAVRPLNAAGGLADAP